MKASQRWARFGQAAPVSSERPAFGTALAQRQGVGTHRLLASNAGRLGEVTSAELQRLAWAETITFAETRPVLLGLRAGIVTLVERYRKQFWNPAFELVGAEVSLGADAACDLAWRLPGASGGYLVDEIKTGDPVIAEEPSAQVSRYLARGEATWPGQFLGVRVCHLRRPGLSAVYTARGLISRGPSLMRLLNERRPAEGS